MGLAVKAKMLNSWVNFIKAIIFLFFRLLGVLFPFRQNIHFRRTKIILRVLVQGLYILPLS